MYIARIITKNISTSFLVVCLGALATSAANEPLSLFALAWIGLTPLWLVILKHPNDRQKIFLYSLAWGYLFHGCSLFWITDTHPMTWAGISWLYSLLFTLCYWSIISSLGGVFLAIWTWCLRLVVVRKYSWFTQVVVAASLWSVLETLFQQTSFWWTSLSLTQSPNNLWLLQLNKISGPATTVVLIVAINGLFANLIYVNSNRLKAKLTKITLSILLLAHLIGGVIYYLPAYSSESLSIGIIQGDIPFKIKQKVEGWNLALTRYSQGYQNLIEQGAEGVITPESAFPPLYIFENIENIPQLKAVKSSQVPFWIGIKTGDRQNPRQSLIAIGESGITERYDKQKLVLFHETIPFFNTPLQPLIKKIYLFKAHHLAGSQGQQFNTPYGKAGVIICYESAYPQILLPQIRSGGRFILAATADGLFGESMMKQHHAQDVLRAIETDRWLVRANSRASSGVIDHKGNTIWISSSGYITHKAQIGLRDFQTIYVRFGDWVTPLLLLVSCYLLTKRKRKKNLLHL